MIGTKLAHYEIIGQLGSGGMGEVYQATDSKLGRNVAIKFLPAALASDAGRLSRFRREAHVLASLNHPNIAHVYGLEESGGMHCIVMELVEGETLQARIERGPMPVDEALTIAMQIAEALEAAHELGITHRDLKPGNVMIRSDGAVKVLDFGLAQQVSPNSDAIQSNSPTLTRDMTAAGAILGTAAYMAPEQARAKKLDKRVDIWAFGVVLYGMITGERLFRGEDAVEILAAVVHGKPDLSSARIPPNVRRVLERCLEKEPRKRLRDISGVALLLEDRGSEVASLAKGRVPASSRVAWAVAAMFALGALAAVWFMWPAATPLLPLKRLDVDLGPNVSLGGGYGADVILSSDGSRIVYVSGTSLFTLRLDQPRANAIELPDTRGASSPFFSPDGKWVGYFRGGLKKI